LAASFRDISEEMDNKNLKIFSTILFWVYIVVGLLTEAYILWLFPYTGLGGLICWPTTIILSFVFGFALLRVFKKYQSKRLTFVFFVGFITIQMYLQLLITPQEIGGEPLQQVSEAIATYRRFDKIDLSDFSKLNQFERVAYIFRNKSRLPESYLILSVNIRNDKGLVPPDPGYFSRSTTYLIEKRRKGKSWDKDKLGIIETDSSTIIIQRNTNGDSVVHGATKTLLQGSVGSSPNDSTSIFCERDDFKLHTGLQMLFSDVLSLTKRRAD
jgi:hypothetical protein